MTTTQGTGNEAMKAPPLRIGWAQADITPQGPVYVTGQFHARVSEQVLDPLTVTAWALQSGEEQTIFVSCDLLQIPNEFNDLVRDKLRRLSSEIDPLKVVLNGTHTHTAPDLRPPNLKVDLSDPTTIPAASLDPNEPVIGRRITGSMTTSGSGVDLSVMPIESYMEFAAERIAEAAVQAWSSRAPGGIAYGLGFAVLGHNRIFVDANGKSIKGRVTENVSHIEGFEDHSLNLLAVYDAERRLTGLVVNVPCPSQISESQFAISADYWHETRIELRRRFGEHLYILPQCSTAGDQCPGPFHERPAEDRMLELKGISRRDEFARRISDAIGDVLPYLEKTIDMAPILRPQRLSVELTASELTEEDAKTAHQNALDSLRVYKQELKKLEEQPELKQNPRWYVPVTSAYRRMNWNMGVVHRYEHQIKSFDVELYVLRLGDIAFATNPFELYLDYGIQMKAKSPAIQTFLVQLAGSGTYLPSERAYGGAYGAMPQTCPVGPVGGRELVEHTAQALKELWA